MGATLDQDGVEPGLGRALLSFSGCRFTSLGQVAGLEVEHVGQLSHQVSLMLGDMPIRQNHSPHDLGEDHFLAEVELLVNEASELEVIDRVPPLGRGKREQFSGGRLVEREMPTERLMDMGTLGL
jgi:hypothetical protein